MAKKLDLHELLELLPAISEIWDDASAGAKRAAARVTKQAKKPAYGWVAVGLAIAITAVVAYSVLKPEEEQQWNQVSANPDA